MHPQKRLLIFIILIGGLAVVGSYVLGVLARPEAARALWGGVPEGIQSIISINMFLGAAGFFLFTYFIVFRLDAAVVRISDRYGYGLFHVIYAAILFPSALWLPLTFLAVDQASVFLSWVVRLDLAVVGAASIGLIAALLKITPREPLRAYRLALVGTIPFTIQTVILDALVWGWYFRL